MEDEEKVIENIKKINDDINNTLKQDEIDKERLFKLRYAQMIQGLYLNSSMMNK